MNRALLLVWAGLALVCLVACDSSEGAADRADATETATDTATDAPTDGEGDAELADLPDAAQADDGDGTTGHTDGAAGGDGDGGTGDDDGDVADDADIPDPDCHYDCFGGFFCEEGAYLELVYAPVPCSISDEHGTDVCHNLGTTTPCGSGACSDGLCEEDAAWFEALLPDGVEDRAGTVEILHSTGVSGVPELELQTDDGEVALTLTGDDDHLSGEETRPEDTTAVFTQDLLPEGAAVTLDGEAVAHDGIELAFARSPHSGEWPAIYYASAGTALVELPDGPDLRIVWWTEGGFTWRGPFPAGSSFEVRVAVFEP